MPQSQLETLSTNLPLFKKEVTLEYLRRHCIPFPLQYIPHTPERPQMSFLALMCLDAFYGGAVGSMKSDSLLMAALQYVDVPGYSALLVRDTFTNLSGSEGLIDRSHEWLAPTDAKWKEGKMWVWPNGAKLEFGYLDGPRDHFNYQSRTYQFVGIDEVVQIRQHQALYLFSRLRRLKRYRHVPIRFRCASNPPAKEQLLRGRWVKERYVEPAKDQVKDLLGLPDDYHFNIQNLPYDVRPIIWNVEVVDPETGELVHSERAFMPATMADNPHLDIAEYRRSLSQLDFVTRKQLEQGDWEVQAAGKMVDRTWFGFVDQVPIDAKRVRFWDLAATKPAENKEPCWTVGLRMSRTPEGLIFVEDVQDRQGEPGTIEALVRATADVDTSELGRFPIRMEQEGGSGGKNTIYNYQRNVLQMYDFKGIPATGDKESRFRPFANQVEAGNVYLVRGPWNGRYLDALEALPGAGWDYGDASSGAYNHLAGLNKVRGRIRVVSSRATGGATQHVQEMRKEDLPFPDQVPIYDRGRLIGYERLTEEDLQERNDLIPVYDQGVLVRCDRNANPLSARRKGIFSPVQPIGHLRPDKGKK